MILSRLLYFSGSWVSDCCRVALSDGILLRIFLNITQVCVVKTSFASFSPAMWSWMKVRIVPTKFFQCACIRLSWIMFLTTLVAQTLSNLTPMLTSSLNLLVKSSALFCTGPINVLKTLAIESSEAASFSSLSSATVLDSVSVRRLNLRSSWRISFAASWNFLFQTDW